MHERFEYLEVTMTAMRFRHVRDEHLLSSIKTSVTVSAIVGSMEDHREKTLTESKMVHVYKGARKRDNPSAQESSKCKWGWNHKNNKIRRALSNTCRQKLDKTRSQSRKRRPASESGRSPEIGRSPELSPNIFAGKTLNQNGSKCLQCWLAY